jgi:predicted nucleic acid-binding protein
LIPTVVVDTDVVSFLYKRDTRVLLYTSHLDGKLTLISFMTIAELHRWTLERQWGEKRRRDLEKFLDKFAIVEYVKALCFKWAEATYSARRNGRPVGVADAWIAATALLENAPLVTHNRTHYAGISNLQVISEAP